MYCKKCGAKIANDSIFCSKCGVKLVEESDSVHSAPVDEMSAKQDTERKEVSEEHPKEKIGCLEGCFVWGCLPLLILGVIISIVLFIAWSNGYIDSSNNTTDRGNIAQIIKRNATNADVEISDSIDLASLSVSLTIHPNCDIDNLEITLKHYDSNSNLLKTQVQQIGNVVKGNDVTVKISITDFSLVEAFKIEKTNISVTGGSVSFFQ